MGRDVAAVSAAGALVALVVLLVLAAAAAWWITRIRGSQTSPVAWFGGFATLGLIVAVTVFRDGLPSGLDFGGIGDWSAAGLRLLTRDPLGSSQFLLNVALFLPAGAAWAWLTRRPLAVVAALMGGSLVVESVQGITGTGAPDVADLAANGLGAAAGAALAAVLGRRAPSTSRRRRVAGATAGLVVLAIVTAAIVGASQRQAAVEGSLRDEFAGTNRPTIEALLATDPNAVFGAASEFADGVFATEASLEIRYPAEFFGLHRCVYVIWTEPGVEFQRATGHACTRPADGAGPGG